LGAVIGLVLVVRRNRGPLASLLIFSGTLFPVLGFLNVYPFRYSYVADHFQYLASLAIIIPGVALLARASERISQRKAITVACSVLLVLISGVLTWQQSHMYSDLETLYRTSLEHNPGSWMAHFNLGTMLADMPGQLPDAIEEYQAALQIRPDFPDALNNLGIALSQMPGRLPDAISAYQKALRLRPDHAEAHNNLGKALAQPPGRMQDAMAEYQAALRIQPEFVEAHYNFGNLLLRTPGRFPDAITEYRAALRTRPDFAEAHFNLGYALSQIPGHSLEAISEYQQSARIKPEFANLVNERIRVVRASSQVPAGPSLPGAKQRLLKRSYVAGTTSGPRG
jgi:tetratricopeptide (TPR) repeat protein